MNKKNQQKSKNSKTVKKKKISSSFEIKPKQLYTVEEIAEWCQLKTTRGVFNAIKSNGLKASRIGRKYTIIGKDAIAFHSKMSVYRSGK